MPSTSRMPHPATTKPINLVHVDLERNIVLVEYTDGTTKYMNIALKNGQRYFAVRGYEMEIVFPDTHPALTLRGLG